MAAVGVIAFASNNFFAERTIFASYFRESVNGLSVGAKVKCQGVPVGEVTDLQLLINLENETFQVPVLYEIDLERLSPLLGSSIQWSDEDILRQHIDKGLRAQLQLESIVTGQMYIELRYVETPEPPRFMETDSEYNEIPTIFSPLAELGSEATGLVSNLRAFNVNAISENLTAFLSKANAKLDELDLVGLNASLIETSEAFRQLAASAEVQDALESLPETSEQFNATLIEVQRASQRLDSSLVVLTREAGESSEELNATLQAIRASIDQADDMLTTDSGIGYQLEEALTSLTEAADALRLLAQSLEQNPSMLIRGKKETDQ